MRDIYLYSKDSRAELRDFFVQTSFGKTGQTKQRCYDERGC